MKRKFIIGVLFLSQMSGPMVCADQFGHDQSLQQVNWKTLFNQLFMWNIKRMASDPAQLDHLIKRSVYYSPNDFNKTYEEITKAESSDAAFEKREALLSNPENRKKLMNSDLSGALGSVAQTNSAVGEFVRLLIANRSSKLTEEINYFKTPVGAKVMETLKDTVLVIVPGFGSHTIKDFTMPELVRHANEFYGRRASRDPDKDPKHDNYVNFYNAPAGKIAFDVVHPMGDELGFSMGRDADSAKYLAAWLTGLSKISGYKGKRFILIGYSKGTSIAHNMVTNTEIVNSPLFKDTVARVRSIVTVAGVVQGAVPAETGINTAMKLLNANNVEELIQRVQQTGSESASRLSSVMATLMGLGISPLENPVVRQMVSATGISDQAVDGLVDEAKRKLEVKQNYKAVEGIVDMTLYERIKWNLANMNDSRFKTPITIFNLSAIANIKDFFVPERIQNGAPLVPPLVVPQLTSQKEIDHKRFSRDDVFLYSTSVQGFQQAPGGLFDTQVAWADTKSMALDNRTLEQSLQPEQIKKLETELLSIGVHLPSGFEKMPRSKLLNSLYGGHMRNLNFVDLGEMRATHWDVAFEQVYKPENTSDYYKHTFPRRAYLASLLETLTLYSLASGGK